MRILKRTVPLWAVIVSLLAVVSVAVAGVMVYKQVQLQNMVVIGVWDMIILDIDGVTELTSIDLGEFIRGETRSFGSMDNPYQIKNVGDQYLYTSYSLSELPADVTFKMFMGTIITEETAPNVIYPQTVGDSTTLKWYFTVTIGLTTPLGEQPPITLTWNGHDSKTG